MQREEFRVRANQKSLNFPGANESAALCKHWDLEKEEEQVSVSVDS